MPLILGKSKKSFEHNIKAELGAGRPKEQALAIAYAKKREAEKLKKMWRGGEVDGEGSNNPDEAYEFEHYNSSGEPHTNSDKTDEAPMSYMDHQESGRQLKKYAHGGRIGESNYPDQMSESKEDEEEEFLAKGGVVDHVVKKYASGGRVGDSNYGVDHGDEFEEDLEGEIESDGPQGEGNYSRGPEHIEEDEDAELTSHDEDEHENYDHGKLESESLPMFAHGGRVKKYASGGEVLPKNALAMQLKKKMRGY